MSESYTKPIFPPLKGDWLCSYEDRPSSAVTLGILAGSLAANCPDAQLLIASPIDPSGINPPLPSNCQFVRWQPEIGGWNVKPELMLKVLNSGARTATWIDADIFVLSDYRRNLPTAQDCMIVCEEVSHLDPKDTRDWARRLGREPGRYLPRQINSALVSCHRSHLPLLAAWQEVCHDPEYQSQQRRHFDDREDPFKGDQDILSGLLSSKDFQDIQLHQLRSGIDIAHLLGKNGFGSYDRLATIWRGIPPLLHVHGYPKPWTSNPVTEWLALNPYVCAVRNLGGRLRWHLPWTKFPGKRSQVFNTLFLGNPALAGLPLFLKRFV